MTARTPGYTPPIDVSDMPSLDRLGKYYFTKKPESDMPNLRFGSALGCGRLKNRDMPEPARSEYLEVAREDAEHFLSYYGDVETALAAAHEEMLTGKWSDGFFRDKQGDQTDVEWCLWFAAILKAVASGDGI